ncbi:MAG: response regulator transcription factor [Pontiellaceae bacterium]|nr:response regulator transcription factor [Pontiellaceae bacterium]MBN2784709.1 response regulator transcription factor [Pontiellaceae bacterium]
MKCLIVEDEEVARIHLRGLLEEIGGIEIIGEAGDCESAVQLIRKHPEAELLFLDVELPDGTSFDIITRLDRLPKLLFVTSHEQYALEAFEVNALDYIRKPLTLDRLENALERMAHPFFLPDDELSPIQEDDLVLLCCNRHKYFTRVSEITTIQSDENYTHIQRSDGLRFVMKKTMTAWEAQLPGQIFKRISRQLIINIGALDRLEMKSQGGELWFKNTAAPVELKGNALKNLQQLTRII